MTAGPHILKKTQRLQGKERLCTWKIPNENEKTIECGKLKSGEVCFGILKEIGLPEEKVDIKITLNNKNVDLSLLSEETLNKILQSHTDEG